MYYQGCGLRVLPCHPNLNPTSWATIRRAILTSLLVMIHWIVEHKGRTDSAILVWNNSYVQHLSQYFADGHFPTSSPGNTLHGVKRVRNFVQTAFFKICQPYFGNPVKKMSSTGYSPRTRSPLTRSLTDPARWWQTYMGL